MCLCPSLFFCRRRPVVDVGWNLNPALRFPRGSGYNTCVREHPRVPPRLRWIFSRNPVFFVTCCTYRRKKLLATNAVHEAFVAFAAQAYSRRNIAVGRYVIMPDHLHLFVCGPDDFELGRWMGTPKQYLGKRIEVGASTLPMWHRGFFDHLLRSDESYAQKWNYVRENPVRDGLVNDADTWPYSGEIVLIDRA